jgi:hypothetical protein
MMKNAGRWEMERAKGFEPSTQNPQGAERQRVPKVSQEGYTQIRAQIPGAVGPELARVVAAWPSLGQPLKAAILAIVGSREDGR